MSAPYRILVTGSRDWDDHETLGQALADAVKDIPVDRDIVIVHGGCPTGADTMAHRWGRGYGAILDVHFANWSTGRSAGPRRNRRMVDLGADLCLAFIRNGSKGASHTAALAEQAGITVRRFTA